MAIQPLAIGDALFTKTQQRVLGLLFGKPDKSFYANEIVRFAAMGRGTVRRELDKLTSVGLLVTFREGNQQRYQANRDSSVFNDISNIVRKTFGVADVLRKALQPIDGQLEIAFVYGSIAKGGEDKMSDIDLMLVGSDLVYGDIIELLIPVEIALQRPINPTIYDPDEFKVRLQEGSNFLARVKEQPKLMVKGVIDDTGKPGSNQAT